MAVDEELTDMSIEEIAEGELRCAVHCVIELMG